MSGTLLEDPLAGAPASGGTGPTFSADAIDTRLVDIGLLIGVLQQLSGTPTAGTIGVNLSWFSTTLSELAKFPERAAPLLDLLNRLLAELGGPDPIDPAGSAGAAADRNWYPIPYKGQNTNFYVVLPAEAGDSNNLIGLGFSNTWQSGNLTAHSYCVFPVCDVPNPAADVFVAGAVSAPIEAHLDVSYGSGTTQIGFRLTGWFTFSAAPTFSISLIAGSAVKSTYSTVQALIDDPSAKQLLIQIIQTQEAQQFLNKKLGSTSATPGVILGPSPNGVGYLSVAGGVYALADLTPFVGKSTLQFAEIFFRVVLNAVANSSAPLIPVGTAPDGIYVVKEAQSDGSSNFGVLLRLPPIALPLGSPGTSPSVTLQLGSWLANEDGESNPTWWNRATGQKDTPTPGISLYLLNESTTGSLSFTGVLELMSVGIDVDPPANQKLVQLGSFSLSSVQARGAVRFDFTSSQVVSNFGGAMECLGIGLPLGGSFSSAGGVASSLLAAGGSSDPQASQPVNPTFSVAAAFMRPSSLPYSVQLYDKDGNPGVDVNFPLQRSFGPIYLRALDVDWQDPANGSVGVLTLGLDGSVTLGPLGIDLVGLDVSLPANHALEPSQYSLALHGMNVSFKSDAISLDAGLIDAGDQYLGTAMLQLSTFSIGAFGAYGTTGGAPSLFVFGWTNTPIGGPPYFYVHGIAAGFGFNRGLNLPDITGVPEFPFVAALGNPDAFGGGNRQQQAGNALQQLVDKNYVPMTRGAYWLSAGIAFKSFEMVDSTALLAVEFGPDLAISLLGTSTLKMPKEGNPYVYAELALLVALKPSAGVFLAQGQLTANSYVIDPSCHLTGGFAFQTWWKPPYEGQFVLTVGGYHPMFKPPSYYPVVPRLGFLWNVSDNVTIQGSAYFALTPSCVMGGGQLQAVYQSGNLRAWFDAQADVLIRWKPFYFDAQISVSIGVSYKINLLFVSTTLTVELGAGLHLWGPPTGGTVYIDWYIISFSIDFGASPGGDSALIWNDFVDQMLPSTTPAQTLHSKDGTVLFDAMPQPRIDVAMTGGRITQQEDGTWIVRSDGLGFTVRSSVPATALAFTGPTQQPFKPDTSSYVMGIVPMQLKSATANLGITIAATTGSIQGTFTPAMIVQGVPLAVWGTDPTIPSLPSSKNMDMPVGISVSADPYQAFGVPVIPLAVLAYDTIDPKPGMLHAVRIRVIRANATSLAPVGLPISANAPVTPASGTQVDGSLAVIANTIGNTGKLRTAIVSALDDFGLGTQLPGAPSGLIANLTASLRAPVMLGSPAGIAWPQAVEKSA